MSIARCYIYFIRFKIYYIDKSLARRYSSGTMNLNEYFNSEETIASFSRRTKIPASSLSFWKSGNRPIPIKWMPFLEFETNGKVTRKDLCPENWHKLWPELSDNEHAD